MPVEYLHVGWEEYQTIARKLAATILDHAPTLDQIVAISRGGLTLGHLLTDLLRIPISTIAIQSYTDIQTQGELAVTAKLQTPIKHKHILLVDDVADSGKTLTRAMKYLKFLHPEKITSVTMFYKPHSTYRPDYFAQKTTKWIMFPYESTEMIYLITKNFEKEQKSKKYIQEFLERIGFTDEEIAFVRRHYL